MGFKEVLGLCHFIVLSSIIIFTTQNLEWSEASLFAMSESRLTIVSPLALGLFRVICILVIWGALLYITFTKKPLFLTVALRSGKKKMVSLLHTQRYSMFTVWCWTIQVSPLQCYICYHCFHTCFKIQLYRAGISFSLHTAVL